MQHKKRKSALGALERSFNTTEREEADKDCARMFYTGALSFNFVKNPYFRRFCLRLANNSLVGYSPPIYNKLITTLLVQEKTYVQRLIQSIKDTWKRKRVFICSDGWSDRQSRPLINIMATFMGGPIFVKAIDASGNIKSMDYIARIFLKGIEEIGAVNVVQIVIDNAANYKAVGQIIEIKYPHIFWMRCSFIA